MKYFLCHNNRCCDFSDMECNTDLKLKLQGYRSVRLKRIGVYLLILYTKRECFENENRTEGLI